MSMEEDARRQELLTQRRELLLQKKEQLEKTEKVYREDTDELITAPSGLSGSEIIYRDDTENKGKEKGQFFGMQMLRGIGSMFASTPQMYGTELVIDAEAYSKVYNDDFGFGDIVNIVNPFTNSFRGKASMDKLVESLGGDRFAAASKVSSMGQTGREIIEKNKKFLDESGLSKKDTDGIFYDIGSGTASLATAVGMTMVTKNPATATAFFGEMQKTQFYQEARAAGVEPDKARLLANTAGVVEGGLEYIGGKVFLDAVAYNGAIKRILVRTASESIQEGAQTAGEEVLANVSGVRNKSAEEILTSIGYSAVLGAIISAPVNTTVDFVERRAIEAGVDAKLAKKYAENFGKNYEEIQGEVGTILENESRALDDVDRAESANIIQTFMDGRPVDDNIAAYEEANKKDVMASLDSFIEKTGKEKNSTLSDFSDNALAGIAKILEPISTTIRQISEPLFYQLRKFEMETKVAINRDAAALEPFLIKFSKLSKQNKKRLDIALKNTDARTQDLVAQELGVLAEIRALRPMLDNIYNQAKTAGVDVEYRSDFIPRKIKNLDGLLSYLRKTEGWSVFDQALKNKEDASGRPLTAEEKSDIISSLLRGNKIGNVSLKDAGVFNERTIEKIQPEIDKFYETSDQALISYIITANENIQRNILFGKGETVEDSNIGNTVLALVESGQITDKQARVLKDAFNARFNRGSMGKITEAWKNIIYLETMGSNFGSTLRQIGDVGVSAAQYGVINTAKALSQAVRGKSVLNLKEIGIEKIAQEFEGSSYTGRLLEKVFTMTGLNKMDRLGKRTVINAAYNKLKKEALAGDASLKKDLETIFGSKSNQVLNDMANNNITDDVKFVLFNKLLDVQPVALSEMPAMYLQSGNGRIFYTLKSFTIRQIDLYRRESVQKIRKGIATGDSKLAAEGLNNGMRLIFFSVAMNAGVDYAWDFIKNIPSMIGGEEWEPPALEDRVVDNIIKSFGLNKYGFDQMSRPYMPDTPYDVLTATIAPPAKTINNMWKDFQSIKNEKLGNPKDLQTLRSLPVGGELYYFWFGGGEEKKSKASEDSKFLVK